MKEHKIKILYVDDEVRNVTSFKRSFRRMYKIDTATSAKEGMEMLKENTYEIVLTDQRMPEMTGVEFLSEICALYPDSMRILITAYTDVSAVIEAINLGHVYKYVSKPYEEEELIQIFNEAYQVYKYRKEAQNDFTKYKEAFDGSGDPMFLVNTKGEFIDVNQACLSLLGHTRSSMFSTPLSYFFEKKQQKKDFMQNLKKSNTVVDFDALIKTKDGTIDCLMSLKKLELDGNKTIVYQGSLKNISRLKSETSNLITDIVQKQERERQRVAEILHESLAQKLAGIKFYISTLRDVGQETQAGGVVNTANSVLDTAFDELRSVCFNLIPRSLDLGLKDALEETIKRLEDSFDVTIEIDLDDGTPDEPNNKLNWFRALQEILYHLVEEHPINHIEVTSNMTKNVIQIKTLHNKGENNHDEWFKLFEQKLTVQKGDIQRRSRNGKLMFEIKF